MVSKSDFKTTAMGHHMEGEPCLDVFGAPYETTSLQVIINQLWVIAQEVLQASLLS